MNKANFSSPFSVCVPSVSPFLPFFFFFYCPARISSTMLNRNGGNGQVRHIVNSKKKTPSLSTQRMILALRFFVLFHRCSLLCWESYFLFQIYWKTLPKFTLNVVSYTDWCSRANQLCIHGINVLSFLYLVRDILSCYILLNLICQTFVKDFCIHAHEEYWSIVFFSCNIYA